MSLIPFDPECVYYDSDLKKLSKAFDDLSKAFKVIRKRAERRQSQRIDKSYFDYVSKRQALDVVPQVYFDFVCNSVRVCIYRYRRHYGVLCIECDYPFESIQQDYHGVGKLYGCFDSWQSSIPLFVKVVQYVSNILEAKHYDTIPF